MSVAWYTYTFLLSIFYDSDRKFLKDQRIKNKEQRFFHPLQSFFLARVTLNYALMTLDRKSIVEVSVFSAQMCNN